MLFMRYAMLDIEDIGWVDVAVEEVGGSAVIRERECIGGARWLGVCA